ncbi:uncharacterized protein GVI51_I00011 [Nakaseomyces glabratus]|uniref:uncharacterized protein n=1 Tax=Candida glabrata TaxID=5478 RepID=UPI00138B7C7C|nr:uncharacterized protein GVI51_I00011 [Nakaseomyces glabratus]
MRFRNILLLAANTVFYCTSVLAKTYENQEIVLDSVTLGLTTYEDDELMVLKNAKVTLNDFTTIKLPEGISLSGNSVLTITAPSGDGTPYSIVINGKVSIDDESQFIFDGSSLSYKADVQDFNAFTFDINTGADGVFISKNSLMRIKLPKTTGTGLGTSINFNPSIHIGGTYKAPNNSPLAILGKLEVLKSESKVDGYFDDRLWRVDLGPDHIDENGVFTIQNDLSGNIHCQAYIGVYADIFKGTENVLIHAIGYQGYSVVSPITIDLGEGPVFDASVVLNYILLPEGQDGFKFLNLNYLEYGNSALFQLGFIYFFDGNSNDVIATAENNVIEVKNLKSQKSISITGDHNYNITTHYNEGNNDARKGYFSFHQYENEIVIFLQPIPSENPDYTTTIDKGNGDFETDLVSHITTKDSDGKPTTITTTIPLFGPAPPAETKTVDLGNEVTEYLVISYWTTTNEFGGLITTSSTRTYSPPPVTVTATTAADYVESDWISFFITTDEKGDIVTSSTLFNATRDYNLPEAPHTSFGPAPPAETKTVDLGNEVTEYLVISYWTTTNEFGGLITTSSTRTYSPPPVTVTATTAADYVESDWISFFITTDEKGDIVTSSTLFNATRDYNLPEAPHTSFGPAPPAETKTVDLGNEVTEYLVISYWTTTNEFGGLITTSSTRTYSPPPVTVTATTAADYVESDWISFFITTDEKGDIVTSSTLFNATRDYNLPEAPHTSFGPAPPAETKTVDLGNEVTEYLVISYWTTTNEFGGLITTSSTRTYSPPPVTITATTAADYVETDWISFFITTDEKGDIVTSSTLFNATRDYNLPEAPHTSFGPAPPAETKTVDLGNEVTEYLVISYWTTTNEFGGLITTSSTRTYSPPPVTITATTAADYVETDWISFFITTDEKGDIVTSSTLFNATRDYNLPEAPHTSFGPAPPAETKTVDLGNEVTEYLVISYWTTTNEFGGLITTSSTRTYSPPPVTVTATTAADYVESDWISFFITTDEKGDIVTSSTLFNATRDYNLPEAPHTSFGPAPPAETKTVDLGNEVTEYLVISYWTTTNEFGGLITTSSTRTYSPPPVTITATTAADYVETDWISFFITTDEKGDIVTSSTLFNATRDYNLPEAPHTSFGPAPPAETKTVDLGNEVTEYLVISYWTTTNEFGGLITTSSTRTYSPPPVTVTATTAADYVESDWISFFITTDEKGDIVTSSTLFNATRDYNLPEAPHTSFGPAPPAETKTVDLGNEVTEYLVISYWTTTNEFGGLITTSSTRTYSPPPVTVTATTAADYVESDWISFFITTNDKGEIITDSTLFNATREYIDAEAPHLSSSMEDVIPGEADYTTTIISNGRTITEVVSHVTTTGSDGKTITYITTLASYDQVDEGVFTSPAPYSQPPVVTTTVTEDDGSSKTVVISYSPSEGEDGVTRTGTTTISTITASGEADYTTTIDKGNGDFETDLVSHITTKDSDGKPTTITTTIPLKPSDAGEADYTTTIDKGNGDFETDLVSHITTKDSDGKPTTITTTIPLKPSDAGEADYTTTITSDGHTITEVVSHITTTDSDGNTVTYTTTMASFDQVDDGVYTSAPPYSQPPVVTTTVTEDDGSSKTVVISYSPSEGEDGVTRTGTTTISTITASGEADYTTTIDKGNGEFETDLVSHITTKDSDGKPTTIITTVTLTEEPDYTSVFVSDGHTITAVVSHVTTTNDIGQTVTTTVTVMSYDQVDEGVYTSAPAYSQPPVTTTTVSADTATATVVISYFPSIGDYGVTRTGTTTISTVSVGGEADYTTTVDRGNGSTETDVISHITTTDSNGNPTTITTTITNAPAPSNSKANIGSDHTTTVVSNGHTFTGVVSHSTGTDEHGHTIVSTVTQTVGGQSHGSTVSSAKPVSTVSGAGSNAPGTAGVGGIVNSQKPQSGNVAGQGSGNEKPTQAAGTAGGSGSGSGSGSVHQSAGNNVPSGSPSVQSAKGTASPVSGIHSSQTPHSVPSQAQTQGQAQAQSSRQQAATTALLPSGSSVDNFGSGFSSTQTASVLQGKGASIKVTSISILFSIIAVIVVGMI